MVIMTSATETGKNIVSPRSQSLLAARAGTGQSLEAGVFCLINASIESAIDSRTKQSDTAPASRTPLDRSPRRLERPTFATRPFVESLPAMAVLRKNSFHGAGPLIFEGSHLHRVWTKMSGDFNRALTILLVEAAV